VPHVSQSALSKICTEIKEHGMPDLTSRADMLRGAELCLQDRNSYGDLLQDIELIGKNGKPVQSIAVNLASYLSAAFSQGGSYTDLVVQTLAKKPSLPDDAWRLIIYSDEIDAGDPVAPRGHTKKLWAIYFSFVEFGPLILSQEEAWLTIRAERTIEVDAMSAGLL